MSNTWFRTFGFVRNINMTKRKAKKIVHEDRNNGWRMMYMRCTEVSICKIDNKRGVKGGKG